jgi:EAL domain-containing protein (putative c-di-GMP-specific phosphodiesterase class I)
MMIVTPHTLSHTVARRGDNLAGSAEPLAGMTGPQMTAGGLRLGHSMSELLADSAEEIKLERVLGIVRRHLGMDVAFISRFRSEDRVLDHVDSANQTGLYQGQEIALFEGYCLKVVRGELPELIADTSRNAVALAIPATLAIPIGSHLSVPIVLEDQRVYGTLCCFSHRPNRDLSERDVLAMRAFAEVLALHFDATGQVQRKHERATASVQSAMDLGLPRMVFQPIYAIAGMRLRGFECLARFDIAPYRSPDRWFSLAHEVGLGLALEYHAIEKALGFAPNFADNLCLNVNSSPELLTSGKLQDLASHGADLSRVVLEITEHAVVHDYAALGRALAPLRAQGMKLAVDDVGAGYSSMRHILSLKPDIIKLDMNIARSIDTDSMRKALAKGLTTFAHEIGSLVVAEGVETRAELETLAVLGVDSAQGYFLAKPLEVEEAIRLSTTS